MAPHEIPVMEKQHLRKLRVRMRETPLGHFLISDACQRRTNRIHRSRNLVAPLSEAVHHGDDLRPDKRPQVMRTNVMCAWNPDDGRIVTKPQPCRPRAFHRDQRHAGRLLPGTSQVAQRFEAHT